MRFPFRIDVTLSDGQTRVPIRRVTRVDFAAKRQRKRENRQNKREGEREREREREREQEAWNTCFHTERERERERERENYNEPTYDQPQEGSVYLPVKVDVEAAATDEIARSWRCSAIARAFANVFTFLSGSSTKADITFGASGTLHKKREQKESRTMDQFVMG